VRRLSIRVRLTLAFAVAMAVVLGALGAFLYVRLERTLQEQLEDNLVLRSETLVRLVQRRGHNVTDNDIALEDDEEGVAQVIAVAGTLVASSPSVRDDRLVSERELRRVRASSDSFFIRREVARLGDHELEILVRPFGVRGEPFVLAVGAPRDDVEDAAASLLTQLLLIAPFALALSSAAGYLLARAALRPVDVMRERAAHVSSERLGQRLPLPEAEDEIHRLGQTLNEMLERLEGAIERERRFVANASHELRTPLAMLQTELELALRRPRSRDELEEAVHSTAEEVDRLARLAEDLLVLARIENGRLPLRTSELDVGELLRTVARRFASRAAESNRGFGVQAEDGVMMNGDELRLEQAIGNLVDNALRHGAGAVALSAERVDGNVEIRVSDEGEGFPADFVSRAFDALTQADEARAGRASGLGLAIVAAVVRAHGGSVRVEGQPGESFVTLAFPAAAGGSRLAASASESTEDDAV
jgi:two-component system OmpR family sensor kinase